MAWHSDSDGQIQNNWEARSAKKRDELSRSIEETLADSVSLQTPFSDEEDEVFQGSQTSIIIPPKLTLQSKSMPAITKAVSTEVDTVLPKPETDAISVPPSSQKKRRLAGRSTKVQLQAVPKAEKKLPGKETIDMGINPISSEPVAQMNSKKISKRPSSSGRGSVAKGKEDPIVSRSLAGSGLVKQGQRDVMVMNNHITPSSVVVVTLIEDPGPVVVKYITLQPQIGFTMHFSDSSEFEAQFNYVILLGELF